MRTFIIALASALLLAALVTEVTARFFPDSYLALLTITAIALLVNGLFNARLTEGAAAGTAVADQRPPPRRDAAARDDKSTSARKQGGGQDGRSRNRGGQDSGNARASGPKKPRPAKASASVAGGPTEEGTVKWFNRTKGYGFIIRENEEEIFVHQRSIISDDDNARPVLRDGQRVRYTLAKHEKGDQAENVTALD